MNQPLVLIRPRCEHPETARRLSEVLAYALEGSAVSTIETAAALHPLKQHQQQGKCPGGERGRYIRFEADLPHLEIGGDNQVSQLLRECIVVMRKRIRHHEPYDAMPEVEVIPPDRLFDCDLFVFVASKGIPPVPHAACLPESGVRAAGPGRRPAGGRRPASGCPPAGRAVPDARPRTKRGRTAGQPQTGKPPGQRRLYGL